MTPQQKKRVVLYGVLLSAVHFTAVGFCRAIPILLMRPEDMSTGASGKPTWPVYPLGEALNRMGDVLRIPFDWVCTPSVSRNMPEAVGILLLGLTSCLWGFTLVLAFRFLVNRLPSRHAEVA